MEEKKEDDYEEKEMEGKRRIAEDMPNIMKYLVPPQAPVHLPLANLPCLPDSATIVARTS